MFPFHIAIDGPVSAGKGTISRLVADKLGFLYIDTGAMYRMTALLAKNHDVDFDDEAAIVALMSTAKMEMRTPTEEERDGHLTTVLLNGENVSWQIRTQEISSVVPRVARLPEVRRILVKKQQEIAQNQNVTMEGRDITYRVLPNAALKIYLTADTRVRAERRHLQLQMQGEFASLEDVYQEILNRDQIDTTRATDPLKIVPDAWVVDTTHLEIGDVVNLIVAKAQELQSKA